MNILRIIYDWADLNVISAGLSTGPYELSISQAKLGHKIYVLTGNLNGKNLKQKNFRYELENGNIVVYNLPRALWKFGPFFTSSIFVLPYYWYLKATKKIDLIHTHQQMGVWLLVYKKLFGFIDKTPVVHTNHGSIVAREEAMKNDGTRIPFVARNIEYPIHKLNDSLSMQIAEKVVAVSTNLKEELVKYYDNEDKIVVVENGVNLEKLNPKGKRTDFGFGEKDIVLGNLGRLSERKNIHLIVEALRYLPPKYKLVLAGEWDNEYKKSMVDPLLEKRDKSGEFLKNRVKYIGEVPYWTNQEFFRAVEIFLIPSKHEGLPKVVLEAVACGCKVIASGFVLNHKIPNVHLLEGKFDSEKLAEVIEETQSGNEYFDITWEILQMYYSWDSKAKEMDAVYKSVITSKSE